MKRKNKIVALFMATIMIISNLVVPVKEVYATTKVNWGKSINTNYYWGTSGDIKIKQIKANGKLEKAFCLEPEKGVTTVEGYKEKSPKYSDKVWNKLCKIAHVGYNKVHKNV